MDSQNTAEENTHVPTGNSGANGSGSDTTATGFACRKCRHSLFDENQLSEAHDTNDRCESYFLSEPKAWMGDTSEVHGKLSCPSCGTKVGPASDPFHACHLSHNDFTGWTLALVWSDVFLWCLDYSSVSDSSQPRR